MQPSLNAKHIGQKLSTYMLDMKNIKNVSRPEKSRCSFYLQTTQKRNLREIYFSHGKLGTPDGAKIKQLAEIASHQGHTIHSIDYTDTLDPDLRMERLSNIIEKDPAEKVLVIEIIHGWDDMTVPVEHSICFARRHRATLHILESDHRLYNALAEIEEIFEQFLTKN